MSIYTLIVIIGTLMIIGGISLAATPLMTFVTAGYFIIILFLLRVSSALSGRLASVKVFFSENYEEPHYTKNDVDALFSEIEKDINETIQNSEEH